MNDGVLVSREWLERANAALFGSKPGAGADVGASSLFYDVRPAVLASAWTQNAAGVYQATAQFIVNDAVDSSFTFPVVAPTATDDPGGDVGTTRFFVIWRGRWEMIAGAGAGGVEIKPCRLLSLWTQNADGVWQGNAQFLNPETGRPITNPQFTVYCPAASGKPEGDPYAWRFWARYNKELERWESLQQPVNQRIYVGGNYISAGSYDSELGGYRIDNEGTTNIKIPGDNVYENTKTLYFNRSFFQWIPSTLDIVGKKEISLVAHYETVVTAVNNGEPTTKQILALGPAN